MPDHEQPKKPAIFVLLDGLVALILLPVLLGLLGFFLFLLYQLVKHTLT